ncbi:hypothetical protein M407DRAFT_24965 [Tulasnella calospora MUT 4182]|uniref:Uncharacterized protein n=1 Tax=Tulasnella calospora MUT 4182 TaxID=1051891 RepID=A0A0C3LWD3_9AGAM|nr:hypothetical protein M407DRAFT_24965 [Tulasnella calospora MUT 4182]
MDSFTLQAAGPSPSYPPQPAGSGPPPNAVTPNNPALTTNGSSYRSWITNTRKDVKSNDKILNQDPKALQQFLLTHASGPPTVLIECKGTHEVEGTDSDGARTVTIVIDFHFTVDVTSALLGADTYGAPVWVVADEEPAKRGKYWRQIDYDPNPAQTRANLEAGSSSLRRRSATPLEKRQGLEDVQRRRDLGLPPWACVSAQTPDPTGVRLLSRGDRLRFENSAVCAIQDFSDSDLEPPTIPLAEWTEEYCASWSPLKEFRFLRTVYGWDFKDVQRQVASSLAPFHSGDGTKETATVIIKGSKVIVQSSSPLWWLYGLGFLRWLLYLTLIYPLILWPIKRYLLGRCWKVAGSSFAFVRYEHMQDSRPGETVAQYVARAPQAPPVNDLKMTSRGISKIVGQRFADWYSANAQTFYTAASSKNKTGQRTAIVV